MKSLGPYRFIAELGRGGMSAVYLAIKPSRPDVAFDKLRVVKCSRNLTGSDEEMAMFLDEARLSARLNHPNVVQTYEVSEAEGIWYLEMEFLDGQALNSIMKATAKHSLAEEFRPMGVHIVMQALEGLHYAHELCDFSGKHLAIVHRDVSPQNIVVTYEGAVKLVDFGIAKGLSRTANTASGIFKGKVRYMAPEQAQAAKDLDRRADVFAMGIVLWECITGERFWGADGEDVGVLRRLVMNEFPKSLRAAGFDVPEKLDAALAKSLAYKRDERFLTAKDFADAIEEASADLPDYADSRRKIPAYLNRHFADRRELLRSRIEAELAQEDLRSSRSMMSAGLTSPPQLSIYSQTGSSNGWNAAQDTGVPESTAVEGQRRNGGADTSMSMAHGAPPRGNRRALVSALAATMGTLGTVFAVYAFANPFRPTMPAHDPGLPVAAGTVRSVTNTAGEVGTMHATVVTPVATTSATSEATSSAETTRPTPTARTTVSHRPPVSRATRIPESGTPPTPPPETTPTPPPTAAPPPAVAAPRSKVPRAIDQSNPFAEGG